MNGLQRDGTTTLMLKITVMREISENLSAAWSKSDDVTVIAILHLLGAEVVNGSDATLSAHLQGLGKILNQCGGLKALGLNGLIANVLSM
jgi:hypothetical protein